MVLRYFQLNPLTTPGQIAVPGTQMYAGVIIMGYFNLDENFHYRLRQTMGLSRWNHLASSTQFYFQFIMPLGLAKFGTTGLQTAVLTRHQNYLLAFICLQKQIRQRDRQYFSSKHIFMLWNNCLTTLSFSLAAFFSMMSMEQRQIPPLTRQHR